MINAAAMGVDAYFQAGLAMALEVAWSGGQTMCCMPSWICEIMVGSASDDIRLRGSVEISEDDLVAALEVAHKAVQELDQMNIFTYCINLDPHADDYVQDIFGGQFSVIDHVDRLPEKLPKLFMSLTK